MSTHEAAPRRGSIIDWPEIHQRVEAVRAAIERVSAPDAQEVKRILKARAQVLAREPAETEAVDSVELVEFVLAHETYGFESRHVREVHVLESLTPLPCTPSFVLGIVNLRGEILSVIDVRRFFDLPQSGLPDLSKVIVLESDDMVFGILADVILGIRRIPLAKIQPSLPTLTGIRDKYLKGITPERTVILDAGKLLADREIVVQEQIDGQ